MKLAILHTALDFDTCSPDELGILEDAQDVLNTLLAIGHEGCLVPFDYKDLSATTKALEAYQPDLVFNLVDEIDQIVELAYLPAAYLSSLKYPYTGCNATALSISTDKVLTKKILAANQIATPAWLSVDNLATFSKAQGKYLIKNRYLDSSIGLHESTLKLYQPDLELRDLLEKNPMVFAEEYIDGREFNVSIYERNGKPFIPSMVEIQFVDFPEDKLKVVGYLAKWQEDSFEYIHTPHRFHFTPDDQPLLNRIQEITEQCWSVFQLNSYARVDFRIDHYNQPWVLEINGNPSISYNAGFALAAKQGNISYEELLTDIINTALKR